MKLIFTHADGSHVSIALIRLFYNLGYCRDPLVTSQYFATDRHNDDDIDNDNVWFWTTSTRKVYNNDLVEP